MRKPKIMVIAGSLRKGSFNKKLARVAAEVAIKAGAEVTLVELNDFNLPLYHGDDEEKNGLPEGAKRLKQLMITQDGFIFSSPEYNSSLSGVFKNAIDWVSRPEKSDTSSLVAFRGKTAAVMSASPGALGGLRGLVHLRAILGNINVLVLPEQFTISKADEAFHDDGSFKDPKQREKLEAVVNALVTTVKKLVSS